MNLLAILNRSEKDQETAQVKRVVTTVEMVQQNVVNSYKKQVIDLEGRLDDHLDVTVKKLGDSDNWCKTLHTVKVDLELAKKNLAIAQETYAELFA